MHPAIDQLFALSGKRALVTGVSRGIGQAIAEVLAQAGADIIGVSSTVSADSEVAEQVRATGRSFTARPTDLSDRAAVAELAADLLDDAPIDILINNAGTIRRAPAAQHADAALDEVLTVDLVAPFVLTRELGAAMVRRGSGKIIFTASVLSFQGGVNVASYAAAKSGVAGITRAFANEWAAAGVSVNAIAPGYIATQNTQPLRNDRQRSAALLERIPAGRWGVPADLAGAALFLASPASDYVHGTILAVDGGWLAR